MIYSIFNSLMALIASVVLFLGMRCCKNRLNTLDSTQNKRDLLLMNYSRVSLVILILTIITYFSISLYFLNTDKIVSIASFSYLTTIIIFAIYMCFYIYWSININKNHGIYKRSFHLGVENAFGFIIGIAYSIILGITINLYFIV